MDFNQLLKDDIQCFIKANALTDLAKLALKKNPFPDVDYKLILNQIESRQKSKTKLPTWFLTENIIYGSKVAIEQTSSEITAKYKSEIISGDALIDLTGGFGIDDFYFSKSFKKIVHCELNATLSKIVAHNFTKLNVKNVSCIYGDSYETLKHLNQKFDWIFIDPSRRNDTKEKVFLLNDCSPNVPVLINNYLKFSNNILIKTAPILDLKAGLNELKNVKKIHIIAVDNDVKELLWEIEKEYSGEVKISTKNFTKTNVESFDFNLNSVSNSNYSLPNKYLYEPNNCIMKSGGFDEVSSQFGLYKLHKNSHLYTSNELKAFPGRIFEIDKVISYSKNEMKTNLANTKKNITIRNFSDSVESIRRKWNIKEGGAEYCFFTIDKNDKKIVLICKKI